MKLSELTYDYLKSVGLSKASIHTDNSDAMRSIPNEYQLELAKQELTERYGDVEIVINPDAAWFDQIKIDDAKWQADYADFCRRKGEWCRRNTAE